MNAVQEIYLLASLKLYTSKQLFEIQDAEKILEKYGIEDANVIREINREIAERVNQEAK